MQETAKKEGLLQSAWLVHVKVYEVDAYIKCHLSSAGCHNDLPN